MKNWLKDLPDNTKISDINLPGTHNSGACFVQFSFLSRCQNMTISQQLDAGIRFFDIRVEKLENKLKIVHAVADCKNPENKKNKLFLNDVISDFKSFLKTNPTETILFSFNRDDGASAEETFDLFFSEYLTDKGLWYKENRVPTLKESRGKIVLLNRCNINKPNEKYTDFNAGINLSNWVYQKDNTERIYECAELFSNDTNTTGNSFFVQDLYGLTPSKKWNFAILPFIKNPPETDGILITFFSCTTLLNPPKKSADYINKRLKKMNLKNKKKYGWIIMDYPTKEFIKEIISSNF